MNAWIGAAACSGDAPRPDALENEPNSSIPGSTPGGGGGGGGGGGDGGARVDSGALDGSVTGNDGSTSPPGGETHRYGWCTGTLDPTHVYYSGGSLLLNEVQAVFDLSKPGEFCLGYPTLEVPILRPDGKLVYQNGNGFYEWAPDNATRPATGGTWSQDTGTALAANDKTIATPCPAVSGGALGTGVFYDHEKSQTVHVCYLGTVRVREDGTDWDTADFFTYAAHSSGARFGSHYGASSKLAVRKSNGTIVDVAALSTYSVPAFTRSRDSGFYVAFESSLSPYGATLWSVTVDGTATKVGDYADLLVTSPTGPLVLAADGTMYERQGSTIVRRPLKPATTTVVFDKSTTGPLMNLSGPQPVMPVQLSANGGLFTGQ